MRDEMYKNMETRGNKKKNKKKEEEEEFISNCGDEVRTQRKAMRWAR